jgi:bifunctional enzyme CysN/CysC
MSLLRFITCGSVDDGKSSLLGRLLWDSKQILDDQLSALEADSRKAGTRSGGVDFALLLDGLAAEREQGITIDVAYRYFSTPRRKFIAADTPGHEQYTRNMITGASTADLAIVLVDARKGVLPQTRRHSFLLSLIGVRHVVLAVNKMDLVAWSQSDFDSIVSEYQAFAHSIGLRGVSSIPLCATLGDNITTPSEHMSWYTGATLLDLLESAAVDDEAARQTPLRLPVQWVNRPNADFRGFAGTLAGGQVQVGQRIRVLPSGHESTVSRIVTFDGDLQQAAAPQSITITLADEVDISRGDLICAVQDPAEVGQQFEATIAWMAHEPLLRGRSYLMKIGARTVSATVLPLRYKINVNTLEHVATESLNLNEIGVAELELDRHIAFDPYAANHDTGGFVLIDRFSHQTVAAGMLRFALRRSANVHWQTVDVDKRARQHLSGHGSGVVWLTGLSGAGKSTLANLLERRLHAAGKRTYLLDGDNLRHGLNKDLGFDAADRVENVRRVAEVARLMADAGVIVITAFISPFRAERRMARELLSPGEFIEVFVDAPLAVAEARDPKGLYRKARAGELRNFTGIDSPYEAPERPELRIDTSRTSPTEAAEALFQHLTDSGLLNPSASLASG